MVLLMTGCSTQKNTGATRLYHQMKTKYNIQFNGKNAYDEGLKQIITAHEDNYGELLPLYPVSDHKAAESSKGKMDITIEKCRKCIKLHSIKSKPKPDPKRSKDPKYKAWLKQGEFNKELADAWILLGKAEFHQGDFLGSVGTFNYIIRHYDYDPDVVAQCQLWVARAYAEMGWQYEAEDMLNRVQADNLKRKHASLYASTAADIKLHGKQYKEAIPFVKLAMPDEDRKTSRARFAYVLGQLYEMEGKPNEAYEAYKKCIRLYPPVIMDFNARTRMALVSGNWKKALRGLKNMTKNYKYHEHLDVLYGAIGDIYMAQKDTVHALENYELAIEKSEQNGTDKASVLLKAGDLYYQQRNYTKAAPCYSEAITILPAESDSYQRIRVLAEVLDELSAEYGMVVLQDSLQHLSTLSEEEQQKIAEQIIADLRKAEAEDSAKAAQAERESRDTGLSSVNTSKMIGGGFGATAEWYFYNAQLIRNGKQEFTRKWGNRPLEDNWRRRSKASSGDWTPSGEESDEELTELTDSIVADSTAIEIPRVTDVYDPAYYLQQIPRTPAEFAESDSLIADALFKLIFIYKNKLHDTLQAETTFEEFCRRFPQDKRCVELYYIRYLDALKDNLPEQAEENRQAILTKYPDSKQAQIVANPQYFAQLRQMAAEQDSLYEVTYNAFRVGQFATVKANTKYAEQNYPLSPLMPRFLFLNAVAKARTEGKEAFAESLRDMISRYPDSELATMSRDMLAMLGQGMESQKGGAVSTLTAKREDKQAETEQTDETVQFSPDRDEKSYVLLIYPPTASNLTDEELQDELNNMLYEVALFNFTRFLIRDFDLTTLPAYSAGATLRISGLESIDEATWYIGMLMESEEMKALIQNRQMTVVPITEHNSALIGNGKTMEEYHEFMKGK